MNCVAMAIASQVSDFTKEVFVSYDLGCVYPLGGHENETEIYEADEVFPLFFSPSQVWRSGIVVACACVCLCVCVCPSVTSLSAR